MKTNKRQRIENLNTYGFGMFIHYGLFSVMEQGEWTMKIHHIDKNEYSQLQKRFIADCFNAENIVLAAKKAGMRYCVMTTRHHDGFSLYDTKGLNNYDSLNSECKRDLVGEFVEACNKHGMAPFLYHTMIDWHNDLMENDFKSYLQYLRDSIKLLCVNYGKIGGFWFDGMWEKPDADWENDKLYSLIRKYQPDAILTNNTGLIKRGELTHKEIDCVTFEREPPLINLKNSITDIYTGEMCEVIGSHWGYADKDINFKSMECLLTNFLTCRKFGANFLLNVSPRGDGTLSYKDILVLDSFSKWMDVYKESIYETRPCLIKSESNDFCLVDKTGSIYLYVFGLKVVGDENVTINDEGKKMIHLSGFENRCDRIIWIDNNELLKFEQNADKIAIHATGFLYGNDYVVRVAKMFF